MKRLLDHLTEQIVNGTLSVQEARQIVLSASKRVKRVTATQLAAEAGVSRSTWYKRQKAEAANA